MKKFFLGLSIAIFLLLAVIIAKTVLFIAPKIPDVSKIAVSINEQAAAERLSGAIEYETISTDDPMEFEPGPYVGFIEYIREEFPLTHAVLNQSLINNYSLLYRWEGSDPDLTPVLLLGHYDVVPVEPGSESQWTYLPFGGRVDDGFIWGRGTLDNKSGVLSILEASEKLLNEGFTPDRTIYFAFGHDEEVGGARGAVMIAEELQNQGIRFGYILDEGGLITQGSIPGVDEPVAVIGTAEKGYVSLELTVQGQGGHSSMPPQWTAVGRLSRAITALEENKFPSDMTYARQLLKNVGPYMPFSEKMAIANLWLFAPVVQSIYSREPQLNATIRTTTAPTMLTGSLRDNVLPKQATGVVNFRVLPGETIVGVTERVRAVIDDPRVQVQPLNDGTNPSPVSNPDSESFRLIEQTIRQTRPEHNLIVSPYLVLGATDSRHYRNLSEHIYRYLNYKLTPGDLDRMHGDNERISIDEYSQMITFYYQLIQNSQDF
jgi:carboxypeptidase PM20D1